jgi:phosphatidate cytidylyltransferase
LTFKDGRDDGEEHRTEMARQFQQRILIGSLAILILIICIYFSFSPYFRPIFILLVAGIINLALVEYYQLAQRKGFQPLVTFGIGASVLYIFSLAFSFHHHPRLAVIPSLILLAALLLFFLIFFKAKASSIGNLAVTVFGIVYLTITLGCAVRINYFFPANALEDGRLWLAYVLIVSKITDVGAYFFGKIFGKTKLAPFISPQKTLEGAIGGAVTALIASIVFSLFFPHSPEASPFKISLWQSIYIGLLITILAQLGDLSESLLKRDAHVKDSSRLPGLGGILDVVDSLVFTLPFMYLLLQSRLVG